MTPMTPEQEAARRLRDIEAARFLRTHAVEIAEIARELLPALAAENAQRAPATALDVAEQFIRERESRLAWAGATAAAADGAPAVRAVEVLRRPQEE